MENLLVFGNQITKMVNKNIFVIIDSDGFRIKRKGVITPAFEYVRQAEVYIDKYLGGSKYIKIKKVKKLN